MKIKDLRVVAMMLLCALFLISVSSCHKEEDVKDEEAGTFTIMNLRTGISWLEAKQRGDAYLGAYVGDTLKVTFQPKIEYKEHKIVVECESLKKINDSLFVIGQELKSPEGMVGSGHQITVKARHYSSTYATITFPIYVTEKPEPQNAKYVATMSNYYVSSDLLQFVTAEVSQTDDNGQMQSIILPESGTNVQNRFFEIYTQSDFYVSVFQNNNGGKRYFIADFKDTPHENEKIIDGFTCKFTECYSSGTYRNLDKAYNFSIRYMPKGSVAFNKDSYDFVRHIEVSSDAFSEDDKSTARNLYELYEIDHIAKENVQAYIDNLVNTTDIFNLYMDKYGNVKEQK